MKILIVTQYYFPEQFQINEIAPELVKRGHEVTVLCGVPNYPKGEVFPGYEFEGERLEVRENEYFQKTGVRVVHVDQVPRGHNPISLVRNYISFVKNSKKWVRSLVGKTKTEKTAFASATLEANASDANCVSEIVSELPSSATQSSSAEAKVKNNKNHLSQLSADFDVVLGYQLSPITSMYAALEYKKLFGAPVVFYTLDIWPVSAEGMLKSKKNPLMIPINRMSRKIYQGADRILVTSRPFMDYLHRVNGVPMERMAYLPQHAGSGMLEMDLTKTKKTAFASATLEANASDANCVSEIVSKLPSSASQSSSAEAKVKNIASLKNSSSLTSPSTGSGQVNLSPLTSTTVDFMFAGNIGKGQRVDVIIEAARVLGKRKDYKIHMVGDGRMRQAMEELVKQYGLEENVVFYGNQKREDMPKFYKMADVLLLTLRGNNEVGDTIPGKLQMYMTTGKTIMAAINGGAREVINEAKCGSCVKAGDYEGLAKLMAFCIEHPEDFRDCGENARAYFKSHFTLEKYMEGLESELLAVINKNNKNSF